MLHFFYTCVLPVHLHSCSKQQKQAHGTAQVRRRLPNSMDVLVKVRVSVQLVTLYARSQTDNMIAVCLQITALGYRRLQWQQRFVSSLSSKRVVQALAQQLGVNTSLCQLYLQKLQLQDQTLDQVSTLLGSSARRLIKPKTTQESLGLFVTPTLTCSCRGMHRGH